MIKQRHHVRPQRKSAKTKVSGYVLLIAGFFGFYLIYCIRQHAIQEQMKINPISTFDECIVPLVSELYKSGHNFDRSNNNLCPNAGKSLNVLIVILTARDNFNQRLVLRNTWANYENLNKYNLSYFFLVGEKNPAKDKTNGADVILENYIYNDIVTGKFIDSYDNLTLKTISAMEWTIHNCPLAKFIMKCDDDIYLNIDNLYKFIQSQVNVKNTIIGHSTKNLQMKPHRNMDSKYYISIDQYPADVFPLFVFGPSYLISSDILTLLYKESMNERYLKLEDVFITGILSLKLNITILDNNKFSVIVYKEKFWNRNVISVHSKNYFTQFDLWRGFIF